MAISPMPPVGPRSQSTDSLGVSVSSPVWPQHLAPSSATLRFVAALHIARSSPPSVAPHPRAAARAPRRVAAATEAPDKTRAAKAGHRLRHAFLRCALPARHSGRRRRRAKRGGERAGPAGSRGRSANGSRRLHTGCSLPPSAAMRPRAARRDRRSAARRNGRRPSCSPAACRRKRRHAILRAPTSCAYVRLLFNFAYAGQTMRQPIPRTKSRRGLAWKDGDPRLRPATSERYVNWRKRRWPGVPYPTALATSSPLRPEECGSSSST